jgi:hypothetical protein
VSSALFKEKPERWIALLALFNFWMSENNEQWMMTHIFSSYRVTIFDASKVK